jgi:hypothetical protein
MRITINRVDGIVIIDGLALRIDLSPIDADISVVQWNGAKGNGWIEHVYDPFEPQNFKANVPIDSIADFQFAIDAYRAEEERLAQEKESLK